MIVGNEQLVKYYSKNGFEFVDGGYVFVVRKILEALPDWFAMEEGREQYIRESVGQICIGAIEDVKYIGFL